MAESVAITPEAMRKASEGLQKTKVIKSEQLQSSGVTDINSNYKSSSEKSSKSKKSPKTKTKKSKKEGSKSPEESKKKGSKSPKESKKSKEGKVESPVSSSKTAEIKNESQEQELAKPKEQERVPLEQKHEVKVQQQKVPVKGIPQQKQQDILQQKQVLQKVQEMDVPQPKPQDIPQQKQVQQKVQEKDIQQQKQQDIPQQKQVDKEKQVLEKDKLQQQQQQQQSSVKPQQQKQEKQQANQQKQQQVQDKQNDIQQPAKKTQQPQQQPVKDKQQQPQQQQKSPPIPVPKHVATPLSINIESVDSNKSVDAADGDKKKPKVPYSPLRIDLKPFDYESLSPRSPNSPSVQSWSPKTPKTPTSPYSPPYLGARPRNRPSPKKVVECIQLVSDDTDPNPAVTMEAQSSQEVWDKCSKSLADAGATDEFSHFFADILRTEHDMNGTLNRLQQALGPENTMGRGKDPAKMLKVTQDLVKNYNQCKTSVEILQERGKKIPPLTLDPKKVKGLNALTSMCKLETKELNLQEGDQIWITDTSRPNRLKIRNSRGEEGYVPALCAILPTPDKSAVTAVERLQIQLLASWVENVKKMRKLMMDCLLTTSKVLNSDWRALMADGSRTANKDRITRRLRRLSDLITKTAPNWDLNKLHNALFSLEKELDTWQINGTDISNMVDTIANLDKTVLCYQMFTKQLYLFRKSLERVSRPIRIVESWDNLRAVQKGRFFRYIELKVTMESTETVEEIMEYIAGVTQYKEGSKNETVEADQITSASQEERKRFVITGVTHPRNGEVISLQEAVRTGVIDHSRGMYMNPLTGQGISIPEAMNRGFIKVEQTTTTKSKEETKAVGLITIKTKIDNRSYTITGAVDSVTGQQLTPEAARDQGFLDEANGQYIMKTGERIPLDNAIQSGWVLVEYEPEPQDTEYDMKTYAVNAVVDQKLKQRVPFMEAVKRGLIDRDTGSYINNVTGERVYVAEAIKRGFLKAKELEDAKGLDIDSENRVVIERMEKIRKNVLKSMGVISAFRTAAGIKKEEDIQ